jgi:hypothetical protein
MGNYWKKLNSSHRYCSATDNFFKVFYFGLVSITKAFNSAILPSRKRQTSQ